MCFEELYEPEDYLLEFREYLIICMICALFIYFVYSGALQEYCQEKLVFKLLDVPLTQDSSAVFFFLNIY